ncbi:AcrR family transcriptional regulator [Sphingomonas sp. UYAg733]
MSQAPLPTPRKAGRPRSEKARKAILEAAYRLLMDDGFGRLTIEAVAARAGVGKPTIYRYWNNAQELAMAAFIARPDAEPASAPGVSARASLIAHLRSVVVAFATSRGRQITLTMASADSESELAKAFRSQIILKSRETGRAILDAAQAAGIVDVADGIETILDMIYGPVFYRLLIGHQPLSESFASGVVDTVFDGIERGMQLRR